MVIDNYTLLLRVAEEPDRFLRSKSILLYDAFEMGYTSGLSDLQYFYRPRTEFAAFIHRKLPLSSDLPHGVNIHSYIQFLEEDNGPAFDLNVSLLKEYFSQFAWEPSNNVPVFAMHPLEELLEGVCSRPRMYFSLNVMGCLTAMIDGRILVEKDHLLDSPTEAKFIRFQAWVNARHPWSLDRPWDRVLMLQNLNSEERAINDFRTYFQLFSSGESADAMSPVAKDLFESNSGLQNMSEEERNSHKRGLNKIFH
jgi:hypothetical protein